ncbi:AAA family ATPase [Streptomyces specialis]|uniref:AAA family ATPase n=1 Tax=Streptomyces specialis TaxID=498367 RepID=UPI00073EABD7|nr:AAA family ATPase [Streptomyces specialis]
MTTKGQIIVLSGPPGAGKSTVARLLADEGQLGPATVHLHTDDFWDVIRQGAVPPFLPEARRQNETVVGVAARAAAGYAAGGYAVVVDGVVGPWFVDAYRAAARADGVAAHYAVLRPDERTTLERGTTRAGHPLTDPGPILAMYAQFADLGAYEPHALDTTGLTPEESAEAVLAALGEGRLRLS